MKLVLFAACWVFASLTSETDANRLKLVSMVTEALQPSCCQFFHVVTSRMKTDRFVSDPTAPHNYHLNDMTQMQQLTANTVLACEHYR